MSRAFFDANTALALAIGGLRSHARPSVALAEAIKAGQEPEENCASYRLKLERCTQRQTSILLQAALVPPDRQDVCL